jgi:hypothetical protein
MIRKSLIAALIWISCLGVAREVRSAEPFYSEFNACQGDECVDPDRDPRSCSAFLQATVNERWAYVAGYLASAHDTAYWETKPLNVGVLPALAWIEKYCQQLPHAPYRKAFTQFREMVDACRGRVPRNDAPWCP